MIDPGYRIPEVEEFVPGFLYEVKSKFFGEYKWKEYIYGFEVVTSRHDISYLISEDRLRAKDI